MRPPASSPTDLHAVSTATSARALSAGELLTYLMLGAFFGIVLIKSEVISWYRIQEMFRFQSFHMHGVIGTALATAIVSLTLIRRLGLRTLDGERITVPEKPFDSRTRYWAGGAVFGLGWALTGACPGPLFALAGSGATIILVPLAAALVGTWTYGVLRGRLPH